MNGEIKILVRKWMADKENRRWENFLSGHPVYEENYNKTLAEGRKIIALQLRSLEGSVPKEEIETSIEDLDTYIMFENVNAKRGMIYLKPEIEELQPGHIIQNIIGELLEALPSKAVKSEEEAKHVIEESMENLFNHVDPIRPKVLDFVEALADVAKKEGVTYSLKDDVEYGIKHSMFHTAESYRNSLENEILGENWANRPRCLFWRKAHSM